MSLLHLVCLRRPPCRSAVHWAVAASGMPGVDTKATSPLRGSDLGTSPVTHQLSFEGSNFAEATQVPFSLTEPGRQERLDEIPSHRRAHRPATHANNVHVIVLDPLPSREVVVNQPGADGPGALLAQTDAPTPLPQIATPRSTFPSATTRASWTTKSG